MGERKECEGKGREKDLGGRRGRGRCMERERGLRRRLSKIGESWENGEGEKTKI